MFGIFKIMVYIVIPIVSAYAIYEEYEEKFVHRKRVPFPPQDYLHAGDKVRDTFENSQFSLLDMYF